MEELDSKDIHVIHGIIRTTWEKFFDESSREFENEFPLEWDEHDGYGYDVSVYANGREDEDKGHVSVELFKEEHAYSFQVTCIVSLIDASETQRFSQTLTMSEHEFTECFIGRFISHDKLRSDPDDLLPGGILTLETEVWLTAPPLEALFIKNDYSIKFAENDKYELHLESPVGKILSEESKVFRAMLGTSMIEKRTKTVFVEEKEGGIIFEKIFELLTGKKILAYESMHEVLEMYIVADKYDMPFVMETCTCFLKLYLSVHSTDELLEIVHQCVDDKHLKELLENHISLISETNFAEEIDVTDTSEVFMKHPVQNCLWVYKTSREYDRHRTFFLNRNSQNKSTEILSYFTDNLRNEEHEEFLYYK